MGFLISGALGAMENDNDNEKPKKQNGNGRKIKEPPKPDEGLVVDFELPPKEPNKGPKSE